MIVRTIQAWKRQLTKPVGLRVPILLGVIGSIGIKFAHAALAFLVAVVLARSLGPEAYGLYSFALAIVLLAAIPAQVGVPQLIVRETAKAEAAQDYGLIRGLWRWGNSAVAIFSVVAVAIVGSILVLGHTSLNKERLVAIAIACTLIPLVSLANVRGASLRGLRKVVQGQVPESVVRPALLLIFLLIWLAWFPATPLRAEHAIVLYAIATVASFIFGAYLLMRARPFPPQDLSTPRYEKKMWIRASIPLGIITGMQMINSYADIILLGVFSTDREVGIYKASFQVAIVVLLGLQAFNKVLQPYFARLYALHEIIKLQRLIKVTARGILVVAAFPVVVFLYGGANILGFLFGGDYREGATALAILSLGKLAYAGAGPAFILLNMTGHERETMVVAVISATCNLALNFILIPPFGMMGAALGSSIALILFSVLLAYRAKQRLGLDTMAIRFSITKS